jgi:soluble lytic murein transglycosylase-like protein
MRGREAARGRMRGDYPKIPAAALALIGALALAGGGAPAQAQVIEVHVDGSVATYDGPTQFLSTGARPIARVISPARRSGAGGRRAMVAPTAATAEAIHAAAQRHQVDERLVTAVAYQESGFNPAAVSPKGARGVMQLMPQTAMAMGVDASDPAGNIDGGADYLSRMMRRFGGDTVKALAAYNAGPAAVERYGGVPPYAETVNYVNSILGRMNRTDEAMAQASTTLKSRMGAF